MAVGTFRTGGVSYAFGSDAVQPSLPASMADGELMLAFVVSRGTSSSDTTNASTPSGWSLIKDYNSAAVNFTRVKVFAKAWASGDTAPSISVTNSGASSTTMAHVVAVPGADISDVPGGSFIFSQHISANGYGVVNMVSGSQDIGPIGGIPVAPGGAALYFGVKNQVWDEVATLSGDSLTWNPLVEDTNNLSSIVSWVMQYALHSTGYKNVTSKTFSVTGGSSGNSSSAALSIKPAADGTAEEVFIIATSDDDSYTSAEGHATWPPSATDATRPLDAAINFERNLTAGEYYLGVGLVRWDTSSLPDDAQIVGAYIKGLITDVFNADSADFGAEWHLFNPADGGASWTTTAVTDAVAQTAISAAVDDAINAFELVDADTEINRTGYTGLRFHIVRASAPTGVNAINFASIDETFFNKPMELVVIYSTGPPPQVIRPVATVAAGSWSAVGAATIHEALDETTASATDYAESPDATAGGHETKVRLGAASDPGVGSGHKINYQWRKELLGGDQVNLVVTLYRADGTTVVATETVTNIGALTSGDLTLTSGEADSIPSADYATGLVVGFKEVKA